MNLSLKHIFSRQGIPNEIISLRNSLANHPSVTSTGLRGTCERLLKPADGNGYARGCHKPSQAVAGKLAYVVPAWVSVDNQETRTVEGKLTRSNIARTDFPLRPWHTYYDWNFHIQVDNQYTYLLSMSNIQDHKEDFECEWETTFLPEWAWPQDGNRIWMVGRWIYDCGHPEDNGHKTEIHPPKAVASFRSEAVQFPGNSGPTRANNAVLYIGGKGGYWNQPINDQDYAFDLYLPPKPYAEAAPRWTCIPMTGVLPVAPRITPYPTYDPKALRVVIPLKGVTPTPEQYGAILSAGWSDPRGTESAAIQRVRVRVTKIYMDTDYDTDGDEWYVYIGVNGRWKVYRSISGSMKSLDISVELDLHPADQILLTANGFEANPMHNYMGDNSGYTWEQISDPNITQKRREEIEDHVFWQLSGSFNYENKALGHFWKTHNSTERGSFPLFPSKENDYRLEYTIEGR